MFHIIVAFPKIEEARNIAKLLTRYEYEEVISCSMASQVIAEANQLDGGVVISGYKLPDMHYQELYGYLPKEFTMLLVASPAKLQDCISPDIVQLRIPLQVRELLTALNRVAEEAIREQKRAKRYIPRRNEKEKMIINEAKQKVMEKKEMSESEAHRYIQKISMDSGNSMVETAEMILAACI